MPQPSGTLSPARQARNDFLGGRPRRLAALDACGDCGTPTWTRRALIPSCRAVGTLYPAPDKVPGKGDRWLKDALGRRDRPASGLRTAGTIRDIADLVS